MRPTNHTILSAALGGGVWISTGEPLALPIAIGAGAVVDIDHLPDMIWHHYLNHSPTATLALHAWEWFGALLLASIYFGFPWWLSAATLGYGSHILTDFIFHRRPIQAYSITYRLYHRFDFYEIFPEGRIRKPIDALLTELHLSDNDDSDSISQRRR